MSDGNKNQSGQYRIQRRRHFRILYPESTRPWLVGASSQHRFQIYDISEEGIKFIYDPFDNQEIPLKMHATVGFLSGQEVTVSGTIARIETELAVLRLDKAIPYKIIHGEELHLIRKFKGKVKGKVRSKR